MDKEEEVDDGSSCPGTRSARRRVSISSTERSRCSAAAGRVPIMSPVTTDVCGASFSFACLLSSSPPSPPPPPPPSPSPALPETCCPYAGCTQPGALCSLSVRSGTSVRDFVRCFVCVWSNRAPGLARVPSNLLGGAGPAAATVIYSTYSLRVQGLHAAQDERQPRQRHGARRRLTVHGGGQPRRVRVHGGEAAP